MIRKWTLKRNLVVVNVILLTAALLYSSIMLIRYSGEVSLKNLINSSYDMLTYVCRSVDDFITTEVKISTEVMQSDSDLKEHLERRPEDYENPHDKLVDIYLMNRYLTRRNSYSRVSGALAGIINKNGVVYNLQYPMDMGDEAEAFAETLMNKKKRLEYGYDWYPLQINCFAPETGNIRYDRMIPVFKNLLLDGGGYQGTLIYSLSEEQIYEQYKKSKLLEEGYLYIINGNGKLISHSNEAMLLCPEEVENQIYTRRVMEGTGNYFIENREVVMSQRLNDGNWIAVAVIPLDNMIGEVVGIYKRFIFVIAVILIISVSVSVLLSREAIKPLETMIASMERVENGDFSVRVDEKGPSDIARLIHHYNNMLENTERYIREEYQIKRMKKAAELDALVAQINPHFLYNTLDMINWLSRTGRKEDVTKAVQTLSRFYKLTLSKRGLMNTIEEELEHTELYVELQNMRYDDCVSFVVDVPDELSEYTIPKLTFQPIVENAWLHGIMDKEEKSGNILLTGWRQGGDIVFLISDDGIGIPPEKLESILAEGKGDSTANGTSDSVHIGVYNTNLRLKRLYGDSYGLTFQSSPGTGTEVTIKIPAKRREDSPV